MIETTGFSPSFVGATTTGTFFYTSSHIDTPDTWFDLSVYGLSLDKNTGVISGTPTKYLPETDLIIKAYNVETGLWFQYSFEMSIATNFEVEGNEFVYPYKDTVGAELLRLKVSDASIFETCGDSEDTCFTTSEGIKGYIDHIEEDQNLLFVRVKRLDRKGQDWEKKVIRIGEKIENGNDFIASSSEIEEVVRTINLDSTYRDLIPYFNFDLDQESQEWQDLRWSISPLPKGGIERGTVNEDLHLVYYDDVNPANMGKIRWSSQTETLPPTEYTISVKNAIGQILSTTIKINLERPPEGLAVSDLAVIQVENYENFRVGEYISTADGDLGRVMDKILTSYDTDDSTPKTIYKNHLMIKLIKGNFEHGDPVDHFKNYSRKTSEVIGDLKLVNNVLTIDAGMDDFSYNAKGELKNRYITTGVASSVHSTSTLQLSGSPLNVLEVLNTDQFSVGQQVSDEDNNNGTILGIFNEFDI